MFDDYDEARAARRQILEENGLSEEAVFGRYASQIAYFERQRGAGRELGAEQLASDATVAELAELRPEAAEAAYRRNGIENRLTGEDAQATERIILGTSVSEFVKKVYRTVIGLAPSATPQTVIEEVVEGDAWLMIEQGMGDKLRGWISDLEGPGNKLLADDSDMALVEAYSRVTTAYSLMNRRELEKLGLDPTGLRETQGGLKGILRNYRTLFGEVFKRSLALRKSMKEGKLAPEFEAKLQESLGMREQGAVDVGGQVDSLSSSRQFDKLSFAVASSSSAESPQDRARRLRWVADIEKELRPDPETYLTKKEIEDHLALFEGGVARFQPLAPTDKIGVQETWVLPLSLAESLIKRAAGDVTKLEDFLSLKRGELGTNPVLVEVQNFNNIRISTGNEWGANDDWEAGGYTGGGVPEALIDPVLPGDYTFKSVF